MIRVSQFSVKKYKNKFQDGHRVVSEMLGRPRTLAETSDWTMSGRNYCRGNGEVNLKKYKKKKKIGIEYEVANRVTTAALATKKKTL